jgi:hypothetical protein
MDSHVLCAVMPARHFAVLVLVLQFTGVWPTRMNPLTNKSPAEMLMTVAIDAVFARSAGVDTSTTVIQPMGASDRE